MPIDLKQKPGEEIPTEVLAKQIEDIAAGIRKLRHGRLNDRALFLLIQDAAPSKISLRVIQDVFAGIDALEAKFLRKKGAGK